MVPRTLSPACLLAAVRRRLTDEGGFTIIEVLVSAVIVAVVAVGTFTAFDSATASSSRSKARTTATQLAQAEQERVRAMTPSQLSTLADNSPATAPGYPKNVNGRNFTARSSAVWTTDPSATSSCAGMGNEAGYMRITTTVTWDNQGPTSPVILDSLKAVQNGGYSDSRGSLAVHIYNRSGAGQPNIPVTITGPKNYSVSTDSNGCILLGFVPVGSYTVSFNQAGYVLDALPNAQAGSQTVQVDGEETGTAEFNYDQAGSIGVKYMTRVPGASSDTATTGDGFTVANNGMGFPNQRYFGLLSPAAATAFTGQSGANDAAVAAASAKKMLYPFTSAYGVFAGKCSSNDPTLSANGGLTLGSAPSTLGTSGNGGALLTAGLAATNVQAFEPMMKVTVKKYTNSGQTTTGAVTVAAKVTVTPNVSGCTANYTANTAANGTITDANQPTMPYGTYTICAQDKTSSPTKRVVQTVDNDTRNGQAVTMTLPFSTTTTKTCP